MVRLFNALPGREEEYEEWYEAEHIPDLVSIPCVDRGELYRLVSDGATRTGEVRSYLTLEEIDTDDLASSMEEISTRVRAMNVPALSAAAVRDVYEPVMSDNV